MAFFPRNFCASQPSFHPLFRLLDDFESYSQQKAPSRSSRCQVPSFQPKFDVREVENAYELHGELAGVDKNNVAIEFTDPQTLRIRGRVERSYTAGTPVAGPVEVAKADDATTTADEEPELVTPPSPQPSYKATVEDEDTAESSASTPAATPATTVAEVSRETEAKVEGPSKGPSDTAKYWVSERSIGQFSRTFNFPSPIRQEGVVANLKDGILTVHIPKAPKSDARRIIYVY